MLSFYGLRRLAREMEGVTLFSSPRGWWELGSCNKFMTWPWLKPIYIILLVSCVADDGSKGTPILLLELLLPLLLLLGWTVKFFEGSPTDNLHKGLNGIWDFSLFVFNSIASLSSFFVLFTFQFVPRFTDFPHRPLDRKPPRNTHRQKQIVKRTFNIVKTALISLRRWETEEEEEEVEEPFKLARLQSPISTCIYFLF